MIVVISQAVGKLRVLLEMIKFEHTVFALPFAFVGMILAADHLGLPRSVPSARIALWITIAMVGARSAAMAFNRIVDARIDAQNPRTASRAIPAGLVTRAQATALCAASALLLVLAAWQLNGLCLALSPVALTAVLGYSYSKRVTSLSHLVLGTAIGIAPVGAWIAVTGTIGITPLLLGVAVAVWIGGFDVIYALQDETFDRAMLLRSLPAALGPTGALAMARVMHGSVAALLVAVGWAASLGATYYVGVAVISGLLLFEHTLVKPTDLSKVNVAFFTVNGWIGVCFLGFTALDRVVLNG